MNPTVLKIIPKVSEKTYDLSEKRNTYVFNVPKNLNKISISRAIEAQYKVSVVSVNTLVAKGKPKKTYRKNGQKVVGLRSDSKKAYVLLKKGDSIGAFSGKSDSKDKKEKPKKKETK